MKTLKSEKGFTIIELLISLTVTVSIIAVCFLMLSSSFQIFNMERDTAVSQNEIQFLAISMSNDIKLSDSEVTVTSNSLQANGKEYTYSESDNTISLGGAVVAEKVLSFSVNESEGLYAISLEIESESGVIRAFETKVSRR